MTSNPTQHTTHATRQGNPGHLVHRIARRWATVAGGLSVAVLLALPMPAWAHDTLVSSNPGDGARVTEAPEEIELTFSADLLEVGTQVRVTDSSGADVTDGDPELSGPTVVQDITPADSADESYTVVWRVVSSDGHPIEGTFGYVVGQGAEATATPGASESTSAPAEGTAQSSAESTTGGEAAGEAIATPDSAGDSESDSQGGLPLWLFAAGGAVLALVVLAAVIAVRRIGGNQS